MTDIFLHDIQRGDVRPEEGKTLRDHITEYVARAKDDQIHRVAIQFGLDKVRLRALTAFNVTEDNINEFGRFDALKADVDKEEKVKDFETVEGGEIEDLAESR